LDAIICDKHIVQFAAKFFSLVTKRFLSKISARVS